MPRVVGQFGHFPTFRVGHGDEGFPGVERILLQRAALRVSASGGGRLDLAPDGQIEQVMPIRFEERQVLGKKKESPMIAFYAAGIAVMFIMFAASETPLLAAGRRRHPTSRINVRAP